MDDDREPEEEKEERIKMKIPNDRKIDGQTDDIRGIYGQELLPFLFYHIIVTRERSNTDNNNRTA